MKKDEVNVEFSLNAIKKIHYYENNHDIIEREGKKLKSANMKISTSINFYKTNKNIELITTVKFDRVFDGKTYDLFGITTSNIFNIKNYDEIISQKSENTNTLPGGLVKIFVSISIGNTRGMLAILNNKPEYSKIIIPIIQTNKLVNEKIKDQK